MTLYAWIKLFMPLVLEYVKEVIVPGTDNSRTSPVERICILTILVLLALLGYASQSFFALHTEKMEVQLELAKKEVRLEEVQKTLDEKNVLLSVACVPTGIPVEKPKIPPRVTYNGQRTPVVIERVRRTVDKSALRKKMTEAINKYN